MDTTDPDTRLVLGTGTPSTSNRQVYRKILPKTFFTVGSASGVWNHTPFYTHAHPTLVGSGDNRLFSNQIPFTSTFEQDGGKIPPKTFYTHADVGTASGVVNQIPFYTHANPIVVGGRSGDNTVLWNEIPSTSSSEQDRGKMRQMETKQCSRQKNISLNTLQKHFSRSLKDAAKKLGVCPTTIKRICRQYGIARWPSGRIKKMNRSVDKIQDLVHSGKGFNEGLNLQRITGIHVEASTSFQDRNTAAIDSDLPLLPTSHVQPNNSFLELGRNKLVADMPDSIIPTGMCVEDIPKCWADRCYGCPTNHLLPISNQSLGMHNFLTRSCMEASGNCISVKATYKEDTVRFTFSPSSGCGLLFEEVRKRFSLQTNTFQLKYVDDENQLVVLRNDSDLQECLKFFASVGSSSIKDELVEVLDG